MLQTYKAQKYIFKQCFSQKTNTLFIFYEQKIEKFSEKKNN